MRRRTPATAARARGFGLALVAAAVSACATPGGAAPPPAPPPPAAATAPPGTVAPESRGATGPAAEAPSPPPGAPPAGDPARDPLPRLVAGDRWFVAVRPATGAEPLAERHRRVDAGEGVMREEVAWGRSFAEVANAVAPAAQAIRISVTAHGLVARPDATDGEGHVEVVLPAKVGATWEIALPGGRRARGRIAARERVDTPGGAVPGALRVVHEALGGAGLRMTTWYDDGLRPVRSEVRTPAGELVEARAALADPEPTPEACRAAVQWARARLSR